MKKRERGRREEDLAAVVVAWLRERGWEVFQEVQVYPLGPVADIVARKDGLYWLIEVKVSLGFKVMAQALRWNHRAHMVSVAVPSTGEGSGDARAVAARCLKRDGIGLLEISGRMGKVWVVVEPAQIPDAEVFRKYLDDVLSDGHKTYAPAGNARGRRWSPFQATCMDLRRYVEANPGCLALDAVQAIEHHYSSDRAAASVLHKWAALGKVEGVRIGYKGRRMIFNPAAGSKDGDG